MAATKLLANTLKKLMTEPVEGFTVELEDESNLYEWKIYIEGPEDTLYQGGVFQLLMKFPYDFPMNPPELKFVSDFWHPNVYKDTGVVCISILHPPGVDEMSGELPEERWLPTQTVQTILLSVISLLNSPNFSSPANVDASVEWRKSPDIYKKRIEALIAKANKEKPSHVVIPHPDTNPDEREKQLAKMREMNKAMDMDDFMNDDVEDLSAEDDEGNSEIDSNSDDEEQHEEDESEKNGKKNKINKQNSAKSQKEEEKKKNSKGKEKKDVNSSVGKKDGKKKGKDEIMEVEAANNGNNNNDRGEAKKKKKKKCIIM